MTSKRIVSEQDFRLPQFRDANVEDYEFDGTGNVVRKDRWEATVNTIRHLVGVSDRTYELDDVIDAVQDLVRREAQWEDLEDIPRKAFPLVATILLTDKSVLTEVACVEPGAPWFWHGYQFAYEDAQGVRIHR